MSELKTPKLKSPEPKSLGDTNLPLEAFWVEMWMMPITMMARMMGMSPSAVAVDDEPEIDRDCKDCQLPVPNKIQESMDHDLFA